MKFNKTKNYLKIGEKVFNIFLQEGVSFKDDNLWYYTIGNKMYIGRNSNDFHKYMEIKLGNDYELV